MTGCCVVIGRGPPFPHINTSDVDLEDNSITSLRAGRDSNPGPREWESSVLPIQLKADQAPWNSASTFWHYTYSYIDYRSPCMQLLNVSDYFVCCVSSPCLISGSKCGSSSLPGRDEARGMYSLYIRTCAIYSYKPRPRTRYRHKKRSCKRHLVVVLMHYNIA